ncbi:MAG TPA: metallopeptidase TldD-related protein, partial [Bryobacteraceae bacterium]|nr:metallopeptidase TldD-related protein [Bryobacteraceae bacterium]
MRAGYAFAAAALALGFAAMAIPQTGADDDPILRAMRDEMDRSRQLRVVGGGDDTPYFFSYELSDGDTFRVTASLGALISANRNRLRAPAVDVRVGSYDFDNTGHIYSGIYTGSRLGGSWPLDDNYATMRESLWLSTDRAYKTAVESMSRKRAALNSANAPTEKIPDFSQAEPVKNIEKLQHKKIDEAAWTGRAVRLSGIFSGMPEVLSSSVNLEIIEGATYFVTSEGTALRYPDSVAWMNARAEGQASDGMLVRGAVEFAADDFDQLAPEAEMQTKIHGLAEDVSALAKAPAGESFSGPTLFEPQAAAQLLAQLIGSNVAITRKPLAEPGRTVNFLPSEFESKIGSRVLPDWMDITDDPTLSTWNGKTLAGYSPYDLEGVPGKPVSLVEKGVLKNFLTTRQPVKGFPSSNGHARMSGAYGTHSAAITNMFVKASQSEPLADLKKKLIDMCKERGKPYGMLVRRLDYPFSASVAELRSLIQAGAQSGGRPVSPPMMVYRVYPDGREELVRGLRFQGVSARSLRDVLAASKETTLFEFINNAAPLALM